jgi:hypothetical protein
VAPQTGAASSLTTSETSRPLAFFSRLAAPLDAPIQWLCAEHDNRADIVFAASRLGLRGRRQVLARLQSRTKTKSHPLVVIVHHYGPTRSCTGRRLP